MISARLRLVFTGIILIFSFWNSVYSKAKLTVTENPERLNIQISDLGYKFQKIDGNDILSLNTFDDREIFGNKSFSEYIFKIAVLNKDIKVKFNVFSTKVILLNNSDFPDLPSEFSAELLKVEILRNVNIAALKIVPYWYDEISGHVLLADSLSIEIIYNNPVALSEKINYKKEEIFFQDIINPKQLQTLLNLRNTKHSDKIPNYLQEKVWYDSEKDYVKIETSEDNIVKVKAKDIISKLPQINGKPGKYLHLLNRGTEVPLLIYNDNGLIENSDEIYFYGRRPAGDTTWFDNYTNFESFYIYYDESSEGLRFSPMNTPDISTLPLYESVDINRHIEKEKIFGIGSEFTYTDYTGQIELADFNDSRTVKAEGWYWDIIAPTGTNKGIHDNKFLSNIVLDPSEKVDENLTVELKYITNQDSIYNRKFSKPDVMTYFDLNYFLNGNFVKRDSITEYQKRLFSTNSNSKLLTGLNEVKVETKQIYIEANERTNIDYIEIKGKSKPVAINDNTDFNGYTENFKINSGGYKSNRILSFDIEKNRFRELQSNIKGSLIRAGGISGDNPSASLGIGDSLVYSNISGVHILSYNNSNNTFKYQYFTGNDNNHNSYINSLPAGSPIAVVIISNSSFAADFSSVQNLGSKIVGNLSVGKVFAGAFIKSESVMKESMNDIQNGFSEFLEHNNGKQYKYEIGLQSEPDSKFIIAGEDNISLINRITSVNKTDLRNEDKIDVVYISHKNFLPEVERLAEYRRNTLGLKIEVIDVDDIYKEFGLGRKSPHSIKNFLKYAYENCGLTRVFLVGDASWDARNVMDNSISTDWLPTYGYPATDYWYVCLDGEDDLTSDLIVGRLSCNSLEQTKNYVDKLIDYENIPEQPWMKNFLLLSGGYDKSEIELFKNILNWEYPDIITQPNLCGTYSHIIKDLQGASSSAQGGEIREKINEGALWTIYLGHAAAEIFDMDGWAAGSLNNKDRYGILSTISCNTGAFAEPNLIASRNEEYILEKNKGFVAATGSTFTGFVGEHSTIISNMVKAMADTNKKMRFIGDMIFYGKSFLQKNELKSIMTLYSYSLLGDPLIRFRIGTLPDAYISENEVKITNESEGTKFTDKNETATVKGNIYNYGYCFNDNLEVRIIRNINQDADTLFMNISKLCNSDSFNFPFSIKDLPGRHKFTITIDPENKIEELNKNNNEAVFYIDVFKDGLLSLDPQSFWDINSAEPRFRILNPFSGDYNYDYQFLVTDTPDTNHILYSADSRNNDGTIIIAENYVEWKTDFSLNQGSYWLHSRYINNTNQTWSQWNSIPFHSNTKYSKERVVAGIKSENEFGAGKINNLMLKEENGKSKIYLKRDTVEFRALSVKGNRQDNPDGYPAVASHVNIEVGGDVFFDGYFNLGFNVVTVKNKNGKLTTRAKNFETWGDKFPYPPELYIDTENVCRDLVKFIRDSVADDEYLIIATCQSSFRLLNVHKLYGKPGDIGSIDTLFYYLKQFGSKIADTIVVDTIDSGINYSFSMMGWRGAEIGSIPESLNTKGDSALIRGKFLTFDSKGSYSSSTVSKAKKWNSLSVKGNYPFNGTNIKMILKGINISGSIDSLNSFEFPSYIDLSNIDCQKYPELKTEFLFEQKEFDINSLISNPSSYIESMEFDFVPVDEMAVVKSVTKFDKSSLLRGENVTLSSQIENLSLRNNIDSADIRINVRRGATENDYRSLQVKNLLAESTYSFDHQIVTDFLDYNNSVAIAIDPNQIIPEFYRFNNDMAIPLHINKDNIKPTIVLKIDGKYHQYNDYISKLPEFEIQLFDNSPLQITDSTHITVRVNGYVHPYQRTLWSKFESINDGTNLKAIFRFRPDTLQYEDASIVVYFSDNEGNKDTLTTAARLSLVNAFAENVYSYPNPAYQPEDIKFNINFKAPLPGMKAKINIYDLSGYKIDEVEKPLELGKNTLDWNGKFNASERLASGVYFYRINFTGDYFVEPVYGKLIIVK